MCANYTPARGERLAQQFGVDPREYVFKAEAFPGTMAPIIRGARGHPAAAELEVVAAMFGMVPHWAELKLARQTYNSRAETSATKPSFRNAWKQRQFCVIPAEAFYEPCYETGSAVRWRIGRRDGAPLGIAGIWESRAGAAGAPDLISFSMLTVNADGDPLMQRFHRPNDEKRSVVILPPEQFRAWIDTTAEQATAFLNLVPASALSAEAAPRSAASQPG
jgi:putative SOS response-associated peptidase YedK